MAKTEMTSKTEMAKTEMKPVYAKVVGSKTKTNDHVNEKDTNTVKDDVSNAKTYPIVRSYGIACFQRNKQGKLQVLMIKRRNSYEFAELILGKYTNKNIPVGLFDKMLPEEKIDLLTLDFSRVWYRLFLDKDCQDPSYIRKKIKFDRNFLYDGGSKLVSLIQNSKNKIPNELWELPKGRRCKDHHRRTYDETELECALREFEEETGLAKSMYRVYPDIYNTYTFTDYGITYVCKYFLATATTHFIPEEINFMNRMQIKEISCIRWLSIEFIRLLSRKKSNTVSNLEMFIQPMFKRAKKIINGKY